MRTGWTMLETNLWRFKDGRFLDCAEIELHTGDGLKGSGEFSITARRFSPKSRKNESFRGTFEQAMDRAEKLLASLPTSIEES